jgi:hypothetical protein
MPLKGDVSDWLDNGGTAERLYEIVAKLPDWTPKINGEPFAPIAGEDGNPPDQGAAKGGGVLDLIERETGKTGPDRMIWLEDNHFIDRRPNGDGRKPRIVKTYDYRDENDVLLFQVCRYEPKDFRQRKPDPDHQGEWLWSVKGVRLVPYRLPEITEALGLGKPVFIVEGERDVDRLWKIGVLATTNAGGAGKWRAELTKIFAGADVVIIPDNDPQTKHPKTGEPMFHPDGRPVLPGQDHAQAVAAALSAGDEKRGPRRDKCERGPSPPR